MKTVNIHEAKTQLSRLVDEASRGESFIIAKAGKPLVKVVPVDAPAALPDPVAPATAEVVRPSPLPQRVDEERQRRILMLLLMNGASLGPLGALSR
jgi:prevent-host-death family protein